MSKAMDHSMNSTYPRSKNTTASNARKKDGKAPDTDDDEELQDFAADYDSNNDEDDDEDDGNDQFSPHQRMPTQHPATRTCFQLLGNLSILA